MKAAKTDGKSFRSMLKNVGVATWVCLWTFLIGINKIWIGLLAVILYYVPVAFFRCLPLSVKVPVRSVWRHGAKVGIGAEQKAEIMMMEFKTELSKKRKHNIGRYQDGDEQHSPNELARFLGVYGARIRNPISRPRPPPNRLQTLLMPPRPEVRLLDLFQPDLRRLPTTTRSAPDHSAPSLGLVSAVLHTLLQDTYPPPFLHRSSCDNFTLHLRSYP
jgi:hypothetical protein